MFGQERENETRDVVVLLVQGEMAGIDRWISLSGRSRSNASAPAPMNEGSFRPQTTKVGGLGSRNQPACGDRSLSRTSTLVKGPSLPSAWLRRLEHDLLRLDRSCFSVFVWSAIDASGAIPPRIKSEAGSEAIALQSSAGAAGETRLESASPAASPDRIRNTQAVATGLAFCFTAAISVFAAGPEEAGFCPVISKPSLTT